MVRVGVRVGQHRARPRPAGTGRARFAAGSVSASRTRSRIRAVELPDRRHREVALRAGRSPRRGRRRGDAAFSTPLPPSASLSSGGQAPRPARRSSWSRNGTRASRPHAIVMLSTRFTGSSTSMIVVSMRSAASTAVVGARAREVLARRTRGWRRRSISHSGLQQPGQIARAAGRRRPRVGVDGVASRARRPAAGTSRSRPSTSSAPCPDCTTLTCFATSWRQQVEGDAVVADHRLAHRRDRRRRAPAAVAAGSIGSGGGRCRTLARPGRSTRTRRPPRRPPPRSRC